MPIYTTNSTQKMIDTLVNQLAALNWQLNRLLLEHPPQDREIANVQGTIAATNAAIAVARENG